MTKPPPLPGYVEKALGADTAAFQAAVAPATIGSLRANGQRLAIFCAGCGTTTYMTVDESLMVDDLTLTEMEGFYPCPECGYSNGEQGIDKVRIRPEGH